MIALALALSLSSITPLAPPPPALTSLFDAEWERWMAEDPVWASSLGDRRFNDKWSDMSIAAIDARAARDDAALAALNAIPTGALSEAERLNVDVFRDVLEQRIGSHRFASPSLAPARARSDGWRALARAAHRFAALRDDASSRSASTPG